MNETLKIQEIARYWNDYSPEFDAAHDTENIVLWKQELETAIGGNGHGRILDVGTGTGFLALMTADLGYETVGVDIANDMLGIGRKKADNRQLKIEFMLCAGEQLPFEDNSFDAVINCRVLWTLMEPVTALKEWNRILRPGGKVISFMRVMDVEKGHGASFYTCEEGQIELPLCNAKEADYLRVYQDAGLVNNQAIKLPEAMSSADMPGWSVFIGEKAN